MFLVTGAGGFIGSHIAQALVERGERVRVLDNFSTGKRANLEGWSSGAEVIQGDLCDPDTVSRAVQGVRYVLHQAAIPSVPRSVADPLGTNRSNVVGTLTLLEAARAAGVARVVFAGSSSVYGDTPRLPKIETELADPLSPYALHKLVGEHYMRLYYELYGLSTVSLRYFNVFGPRQDPLSSYAAVIPKFIRAVAAGEQPTIYGDGLQTRDFTFVAEVVRANLLALTAQGVDGLAINIAAGRQTSLLELLETLCRIIGRRVEPLHQDARPGDVKHSRADVTRARELLGFTVEQELEQGLETTVRWLCGSDGGTP
ncbi:MAG: NAD-dependent epimerase/dehydratase family protein [Candidatus Alcyoniella australis]|nr:NAD-dependent epimerase/dehydratase family protein [Candidatus Alcyoniella australis]